MGNVLRVRIKLQLSFKIFFHLGRERDISFCPFHDFPNGESGKREVGKSVPYRLLQRTDSPSKLRKTFSLIELANVHPSRAREDFNCGKIPALSFLLTLTKFWKRSAAKNQQNLR